jgi:signal transduction histidine kinase
MQILRRATLACVAVLTLSSSGTAVAGEYGTAGEARAMLDRVVAAMQADAAKALASFTSGEGGFRDRDLYPYCVGTDGRFSAHPTLVGTDAIGLIDKAGNPIGQRIMTVAKPGDVSEVEYVWHRPGETTPTTKVAYATKIGDQICAVGYYK